MNGYATSDEKYYVAFRPEGEKQAAYNDGLYVSKPTPQKSID
jgi:hypothetical protein